MQLDKLFLKIRNTNYIYVILIIGAAVMILAAGFNSGEKREVPGSVSAMPEQSQEDKLKDILSQIEGVGDVSVMITYYASSEKALAYETKTDRKAQTSNGFGGESSDEKAVMSGGEPVVVREIYPEVKGVVVIAQGAESPAVCAAIGDAVSTSLGIAVHKICVLPKSAKGQD